MPKAIDIAGRRFGRLTATKCVGTSSQGRMWVFVCDCGAKITRPAGSVRAGASLSCGCLQREAAATVCREKSTHGSHGTRLYNIWRSMRARCGNPNNIGWEHYGGKGIRVCDAWAKSFLAFKEWAEANGYSDDLTIDRIDGGDGYYPENCRWVTYKSQAENRRSSRFLLFRGATKTVSDWSRETGIPTATILYRLKAGVDVGTALTDPPDFGRRFNV